MSTMENILLICGFLLFIGFFVWLCFAHSSIIWSVLWTACFAKFVFLCCNGTLETFFGGQLLEDFSGKFPIFLLISVLVICLAQFVFSPRKALVDRKEARTTERYSSAKYYVNLNTGNIRSVGGGSHTTSWENFYLFGSKTYKTFKTMDSLGIWENFATGECDILSYNRFGKYGVRTIPDWFVVRIPLFIKAFLPTVWLWFLGTIGGTYPLTMIFALSVSLWHIYYNKKIYYSLADGHHHGCLPLIYWISTALETAVCLYNIFAVGGLSLFFIRFFGAFIVFNLISSLVLFKTHK